MHIIQFSLPALAFALSSCSQPLLPDVPGEKASSLSRELAGSLERCGLDLTKASFFEGEAGHRQYRYIRLGEHPVLNEPQMDCLAGVLVPAEIGLRTDDDAFDDSYASAWQKEQSIYERKLANELLSTNRPELVVPQFSGAQDDLHDFVAAAERMCEAPKGIAVVTDPTTIYLPWPQQPADEAGCLFAVLTASDLNEHGIEVVWGGVP